MTDPEAPADTLPASEHTINRELSLLQFQRRVLAQAADRSLPLLERLRFLCIVSSNLDEFFEVRVAGIKARVRAADAKPGADGLSPRDLLTQLSIEIHDIMAEQYLLLNEDLLPALAAEDIVLLRRDELDAAQQAWLHEHFLRELMPVLTPIGLDPAHPFPRLFNKSLNFIVELSGRDAFGRDLGTAIVQLPRALPRLIRLPDELSSARHGFVFLSSALHLHVGELFPGMTVEACHQFRVTRNSDLYVDEEEAKDLRTSLKGELQQRHYGDAVRLEVVDNCPPAISDFLLAQLELETADLYCTAGLVDLLRLLPLVEDIDERTLHFPPFVPGRIAALEDAESIFVALRRQDILLHHPFQSFAPVVELLHTAAEDPDVVAIKMTVYRTGTDSVLMEHLLRAAERGKEVTVVLELMARFDEEANIGWANRLEAVGAHVRYGVFGFKTHAKMLLVLRREESGLCPYVHLGTGNYHPRTTLQYTDFGLLTADTDIGEDVATIFKQLTGLGSASELLRLWQAPFSLHRNVIAAIDQEIELARAGRPAHIIAKMNALLEAETIAALYRASQAGVEIELIIRGPCALRPGVEGLSERIRVRSIVGRFLEHHRIFFFHADGAQLVYLSSADWMERNFFRRVEIAFPILDPALKRRVIKEGLKSYLADNCQAWEMQSDGRYRLRKTRGRQRSAQQQLLAEFAEDH